MKRAAIVKPWLDVVYQIKGSWRHKNLLRFISSFNMNPRELFKQYILSDGVVKSIQLDVTNKIFKVRLAIRRSISKNKQEPCILELEFGGVTEVCLYEDFLANGGYSDITLTTLDNGELYLSLDPYGNTGETHQEDNWIIKASSLSWQEINLPPF